MLSGFAPALGGPSREEDMPFAFMLAAIVVITVIALLAVGRLGELPEVESDRAPIPLPQDRLLIPADVDEVRFSVGVRGYRMDEVDGVLDRLAAEAGERDERIAELESQLELHDHSGSASVGIGYQEPESGQPIA